MRRQGAAARLRPGRRLGLALLWLTALPALGADIDRFVRSGPLFLSDTSLAAVRELGTLRSESVKRLVDPYDPLRVDEFRTLVFDGLEIYGLVDARQVVWPMRVTVTQPQWKIRDDLGVGTSVERLVAVLGAPAERTAEVLLYRGQAEYVNFFARGERIERIEFIYYAE
jgi:hypothetical protein